MQGSTATGRPRVGISTDLHDHANGTRVFSYLTYAEAIWRAGGWPFLIAPIEGSAREVLARCDALILTGGDDPRMEDFGEATHPGATPLHAGRQRFELGLIAAHRTHTQRMPVLGVCLGMQLMALLAEGRLDQHLPESCATHADHWEREHAVVPADNVALPFEGTVRSKHRQAVSDPGGLRVIARAHDGLIEAIDDPEREFYVGVQWHPERTSDDVVGQGLFDALVAAGGRYMSRSRESRTPSVE